MPTVLPRRCAHCVGVTPHQVVIDRPPAGPVTRVLECGHCETRTPYGISCPSCGNIRFRVVYTRPQTTGTTVRVKQCRHCAHRICTREKMASTGA